MPVEINGIELSLELGEGREDIPVFKPEVVGSGIVNAFIASEVGQTFNIVLTNKLDQGLRHTTFIDGREMHSFTTQAHKRSRMEGMYGRDGVRPFVFSKLQTKDDDGLVPSVDVAKLGTIEVHCWRGAITYTNLPPSDYSNVKGSLDPISEKTKKLSAHSVSLGAAKPMGPLTSSTFQSFDLKPYVIIRLWYKPYELLQAEGIAPPRLKVPVKPREDNKRPRSAGDDEENGRTKRPATEQDVKPNIPQPGASGSGVKVEGVKKERVKGEVIDLTSRSRSPIRVPVKGEVIEIDDD